MISIKNRSLQSNFENKEELVFTKVVYTSEKYGRYSQGLFSKDQANFFRVCMISIGHMLCSVFETVSIQMMDGNK